MKRDAGLVAHEQARFILAHGWRASAYEMAHVLGVTPDDVERVRRTEACTKVQTPKKFAELYSLWHGRVPEENEWPAPRKGRSGQYEWIGPEIAMLASLVGVLGIKDLVQTLTARLKEVTGDLDASRNKNAVQVMINRIGLQSSDVVGGITTNAAAEQINSLAIVHQAIDNGDLRANRVGRLWVIPHAAWEEWKSKRVLAPAGYVRLASIKEALGITSDKLPEFANKGYIPTAIRCNPNGGPSTKFGTWWISPETAKKLVDDRHAGRPMPWHGKAIKENLDATYKLWEERKHPATCPTCITIWGTAGAPSNRAEFQEQYVPLAHGAKRHLTRAWDPGFTPAQLAKDCAIPRTKAQVLKAIANGVLQVTPQGGVDYVTRSDASKWQARKCPLGDNETSWVSLETACKLYMFTMEEIEGFIATNKLTKHIGTQGAMRGISYVPKQMCRNLRETIGFSEEEAAKRAGVSVERFREVLEGVNWRRTAGIPLSTLQAVIKRLESKEGYTLEEAAVAVGESLQWVIDRKLDGTVTVLTAKWDREREYLREPMIERLRKYKANPPAKVRSAKDWLQLSPAAKEAGVTTSTIIRWAEDGELAREMVDGRWRYPREAVRARARIYWPTVRFHRAVPPAWLQVESKKSGG
ncbi:hypothetical protein [Polaromonas sp.]|uniref:hypothetical protein n=1 Tax=Polaromonas sp. TaxID=1869339 RepID=UPI00352B9E23